MSINVGDKVRVEFKDAEGMIEGRVQYVYGDGDIEIVNKAIFAGTDPEAYTITVLEKREIEVGDVVKGKDLFDVVPVGSVVQSNNSGQTSFITEDSKRTSPDGYVFLSPERWFDVDFTVLFISPKEV